jgi:hypothetical protein
MRSRRIVIVAAISAAAATMLVATHAAWAQTPPPPTPSDERQVYLVRQDQSDCTNTTVPSGDSPNEAGTVSLIRGNDGNTTVKIAMTASRDTTYHFFLKCVRQLGDITTGEEGTGLATFTFPTNSVGSTYAFDMYPEGAPLGNKFQATTVKF